MDELQKCALAFKKMLDFEYICVLGRKNKIHEIRIAFNTYDFLHLAGLQYIDSPLLRGNRERIFKNILKGEITLLQLPEISDKNKMERIHYLTFLEDFMDSNNMVFKFEKDRCLINQQAVHTRIKADYLLKNNYEGVPLYFFLVQEDNKYIGISFFADREKDYSIGQQNYTLLYKEKINTVTGKTEVQCDKLYDYRMVSLKEVEILKNSGLPFAMKKVDENRGIIRFEKRNAVKVNALIGPPSQLELGTKPPNRNNPKR